MSEVTKAAYKFINAKSIEEIKELNTLFVKGEIAGTCYHLGKLNRESNLILHQLIKINDLGLITTNSQPGIPEDVWNNNYEQRAFLTFLIKKKDYGIFKNELTKINDEYYHRKCTDDPDFCPPGLYWLSRDRFKNFTHFSFELTKCYSFHDCNLYEEIKEDYCEVEVVDPVWGRNTLFDDIIKALKNM